MNNRLGLSKREIGKQIQQHLEKNADILIGVDDPEVNELINVLIQAFTQVIDANNEALSRNVSESLKDLTRMH